MPSATVQTLKLKALSRATACGPSSRFCNEVPSLGWHCDCQCACWQKSCIVDAGLVQEEGLSKVCADSLLLCVQVGDYPEKDPFEDEEDEI